jgi:hypothetical protein
MNNQRIKLSDNFNLDEFVSREFYTGLERMVNIAQFIRNKTGQSVTINNWWHKGQFNNRGHRMPNTTVGSPTSEHRVMNAADFNIGTMTGAQMVAWVEANAKELYALGVRRMESATLTPTWLHLDCKEHGQKEIRVIDLKTVVKRIAI